MGPSPGDLPAAPRGVGVAWTRRVLDPDAYPFLDAPISDAATRRVLSDLCAIEGERVAYEALPIEGLGGIYEALLGSA